MGCAVTCRGGYGGGGRGMDRAGAGNFAAMGIDEDALRREAQGDYKELYAAPPCLRRNRDEDSL